MSDTVLRAALIGCGRIGAFTRPELRKQLGPSWLPLSHLEALLACEDVKVVACCDLDMGAAQRAAAIAGDARSYDDYEKLFARERIDILCVATRTDARLPIMAAALAAGVRGIHSEKPLALSIHDADDLTSKITNAGVAFSYGAVRRYMPIFAQAKKMLDDGQIGRLQSVTARFGLRGLLWTHPHSVDIISYLCGDAPVEWVQASLHLDCERTAGEIDCDPAVISATIAFEGGTVGQIVPEPGLAVDLAGDRSAISVVGDGYWLLERNYEVGLACRPFDDWRARQVISEKSGRRLALEELADAIRVGRSVNAVSINQIVNQQRVLFAMATSHLAGGRRVALTEVNPHLRITGRVDGRVA
jgi:predicted dehydrogenase